MTWTLVEPCCGSAALSLHLLGATRPILPYQGSKWRFRRGLQHLVERLGFDGAPARVQLSDVGAWGRVMGVVLASVPRSSLVERLEALAKEDPREVFDRLHGGAVAEDDAGFAAEYLFLQRLSFSGKAVAMREGRWASPGFNTSSAYGLAATDRFGKVNPMIPSLIRVLQSYDDRVANDVIVQSACRPAAPPDAPVDGPTLVYLDPPYVRSTRYPDGDLGRDAVIELAMAWRDAGAAVIVSEGEAIAGLRDRGWSSRVLDTGRKDTSPFRGKQQEWVTLREAPPPLGTSAQLSLFSRA